VGAGDLPSRRTIGRRALRSRRMSLQICAVPDLAPHDQVTDGGSQLFLVVSSRGGYSAACMRNGRVPHPGVGFGVLSSEVKVLVGVLSVSRRADPDLRHGGVRRVAARGEAERNRRRRGRVTFPNGDCGEGSVDRGGDATTFHLCAWGGKKPRLKKSGHRVSGEGADLCFPSICRVFPHCSAQCEFESNPGEVQRFAALHTLVVGNRLSAATLWRGMSS